MPRSTSLRKIVNLNLNFGKGMNSAGSTYALAILILVSKVKKALANCSPSTSYQHSSISILPAIGLTSKGRFNNLSSAPHHDVHFHHKKTHLPITRVAQEIRSTSINALVALYSRWVRVLLLWQTSISISITICRRSFGRNLRNASLGGRR